MVFKGDIMDIDEKQNNQLLKLFYVRDFLLENTDKNNIVTATDIKKHLSAVYGINIHANTVYTIIDLLDDYGKEKKYGIKIKRLKRKGYYVEQREFKLHELQLLIDCVQSTKFVSHSIASEISDKLKSFINKQERSLLNRESYVYNRIRNMNDSVFKDIENIHACIKSRKKLSFCYFSYGLKMVGTEREKIYYKKPHIVCPFALLWSNYNYYLLAYHRNKLKHFRVDRMEDIKIYPNKIFPKEWEREVADIFESLDFSERSVKIFSMYGGEEKSVRLRFHNTLISVALDRFGNDIIMMPDGKSHFIVNVAVEVSVTFFGWLLGLGRKVIILSPDSVIEEMSDYVSSISKMYKIHIEKNKKTIK